MEPRPRPRFLWLALIGVGIGGMITTWVAPRMIAWYFDPPVNIGINCRSAAEWAMNKLQLAQFYGSAVGLLCASLFWMSRYRKWKGTSYGEPTLPPTEPRI